MMHIREIVAISKKAIHNNGPAILTGIGASGTITTAYLAAKAGYAAANRVEDRSITPREKFQATWDLYIPPVVVGSITVGCIVFAARVSSRRAAAAYSLVAISERAFEEYREKVTEVLGEKKEQKIRDEVAQSRVDANPPSVIFDNGGSVLCCELLTGRYFNSDMETLRKAQNDVNAKVVMALYVPIDEFYYILGLPGTSNSGNLGWDSNRLMELEFSTVFGPDNKPCLAFDYNYVKAL